MMCQNCNKNRATVQVTEVQSWSGFEGAENKFVQKDLCEVCAQGSDLPFAPPAPEIAADVWGLLNLKSNSPHGPRRKTLECPECDMSLDELRRRGRLGCAHCYEVFGEQLESMLESMHGATRHVGRVPGMDAGERQLRQRITNLKGELELAIEDEAYERAATIRDELAGLESESGPAL